MNKSIRSYVLGQQIWKEDETNYIFGENIKQKTMMHDMINLEQST